MAITSYRQSPGAMVQVAEPHRRRQVVRIQGQRALEARLRKAILSEHEGRDARAEAQARMVWPQPCGFGERLERVAKPPRLESRPPCPHTREPGGICRSAGARTTTTPAAKMTRVVIESRFDRQTALVQGGGRGSGVRSRELRARKPEARLQVLRFCSAFRVLACWACQSAGLQKSARRRPPHAAWCIE